MNDRKPRVKATTIDDVIKQSASPFAGSSLVPMLVIGLVLTFAGMIAAVLLS